MLATNMGFRLYSATKKGRECEITEKVHIPGARLLSIRHYCEMFLTLSYYQDEQA